MGGVGWGGVGWGGEKETGGGYEKSNISEKLDLSWQFITCS